MNCTIKTRLSIFISLCIYSSIFAQNDSIVSSLSDTLEFQIEHYGENHSEVIGTKQKLAKQQHDSRQFEKALELNKQVLAAQQYLKVDSLVIAKTFYEMSYNYYYLERDADAKSTIQKSLNIQNKKLKDTHLDVIDSYKLLAKIQLATNKFNKALDILKNNVLKFQLIRLGDEHFEVGDTYLDMSVAYYILSYYEQSNEVLQSAIQIYKLHGKNNVKIGRCYNNLALNYGSLGNYIKELEFYTKALKIYESQKQDRRLLRSLAKTYHNMANAYSDLGNYSESLRLNEMALKLRQEIFGKDHPNVTTSFNSLGTDYYNLGLYDKALKLYEKANTIKINWAKENERDSINEPNLGLASNLLNIGGVYTKLKNYDQALEYHEKGLKIILHYYPNNHPIAAGIYSDLAHVHSCLKQYSTALELSDKALNIFVDQLGENHPKTIRSYIIKAIILQSNENYQSVDSLWHTVISNNLKRLNQTYLHLPQDQRLNYSKTFEKIYDKFYSFAAHHGNDQTHTLAANLSLNTKSLALDYATSVRDLIHTIDNQDLKIIFNEFIQVNKELSKAELLTDEEQTENNYDIVALRNKQEDLSRQILKDETLHKKLFKNQIHWKETTELIDKEEAIIDFVRYLDESNNSTQYYAILTRDYFTSPQFIHISDQNAISALFNDNLKNSHAHYIQSSDKLKLLCEIIWKPLNPYLKNVETIHISAAGLLHQIDFEALLNENEIYLAEQFEFHYYNTIRDCIEKKKSGHRLSNNKQNENYNIVLVGDVVYDSVQEDNYLNTGLAFRDGIDPLPATKEEINKVADIIKLNGGTSTLINGSSATESKIENHSGDNSPDVFHFATHAKYLSSIDSLTKQLDLQDRLQTSGNPLQRSMLILSGGGDSWSSKEYIPRSDQDGILTAYEVSQLDLNKTSLVVLSACNTGLGDVHDTEGILGLQSAFKLAGVEQIIASLWKVNDAATKELMILFYQNLLNKKQDPASALRQAKARMRIMGAKPQNWAGFILIE